MVPVEKHCLYLPCNQTTTAMQTQEPINLLEESEQYRAKFHQFIAETEAPLATTHPLGFAQGDHIQFLNGFDIPVITEILGFDEKGQAYLLWDCYWFTINLVSRGAVKLA